MSLPPYPTGWYAFGLASELRPGAVLSRPFMGEDLVVYRTRSGQVRAVDSGFAWGAKQDFPIWEHKHYRERPALAVGDGPIGLYRRWARQFYEDAVVRETVVA